MKAWIKSVALAVLLTSPSAFAADKVTYQLDWLPSGEKAPVYVGVHDGFFKREGLDVTIVPGRGSFDAITKVSTGAADFGGGGLGALMQARAEGPVQVKAVLSVYTKMPDALLTVKGSGITSLKDVKGRTVATATFTASNAYWPVVLQANGVDPASVTLKKVDPNTLAGLLASGRVDATINWIATAPGIAEVVKQAGKQLVVLPWSDTGYQGYGYVLFAAQRMIDHHRDIVARFVRAYAAAIAYSVRHPEAAADAITAMVPEMDKKGAQAQFNAAIPLMVNDISKRDGMGAFSPKLVKATWVWLAKAQHYPLDKLDPETTVDRSFIGPVASK